MALEYHPQKINELISRNEQNFVVLPNFQRPFVWGTEKQRELIASLLVDLPVGSLLILKGNVGDFAARNLCSQAPITPKDECDYVLDGQQRLSTLKSVFFDLFREKGQWRDLLVSTFKQLHTRWFLNLEPKDHSEDLFGYRTLEFKTLSSYEQEQMVPYLTFERIKKGDKEKWFHPGFILKDGDGKEMGPKQLNNHIKRQAAKVRRVPLYEIYKKDSGLHRLVIEVLANERAEELFAQCKDGKVKASDYFDQEEVDFNDWDEIKNAFQRRANNWAVTTAIEIEKSIDRTIPAIILTSSEISRAVAIFEAVNRGGTPLSVYDLVVARAARTGKTTLSDAIQQIFRTPLDIKPIYDKKLSDGDNQITWCPELMNVISDDLPAKEIQPQVLNFLSLITYCKEGRKEGPQKIAIEHIKKEKHLNLRADEINDNLDRAMKALSRALAFLQFKCGISTISDLPYSLMILPIAYALYEDNIWNSAKELKKIEYWYWVSLLGGRYRERQNEVCIEDISLLLKWCLDEEKLDEVLAPLIRDRLFAYDGYSDKNLLLRKDTDQSVPKAVTKGILQFLLSQEPVDFDGKTAARIAAWKVAAGLITLEEHHIIPLKTAAKISESTSLLRKDNSHILNSPLNLTLISKPANNGLGTQSPAYYLGWLPDHAFSGHSLPIKTDYAPQAGESDDCYYERVLERRMENLKRDIINHLQSLV